MSSWASRCRRQYFHPLESEEQPHYYENSFMEELANSDITFSFESGCWKYNFLHLIEEEIKSEKSETTTVSQWQRFKQNPGFLASKHFIWVLSVFVPEMAKWWLRFCRTVEVSSLTPGAGSWHLPSRLQGRGTAFSFFSVAAYGVVKDWESLAWGYGRHKCECQD